jgi:hypothetical protein
MASSCVGLDVAYLPYDAAKRVAEPLRALAAKYRTATVADLYAMLREFGELRSRDPAAQFVDFALSSK